MKKELVIRIVAFVLPALIAFLFCHIDDMFDRIVFSIPYGLIYLMVTHLVLKGASEEFREKEPVSEKIGVLTMIVVLPACFYWMIHTYKSLGKFEVDHKVGSVWASFVIAELVAFALSYAIKYVIRMFEKNRGEG